MSPSPEPLHIRKRAPASPPPLVLGAMNFGKRTSAAESERIVRRALERGITHYDTANSYNAGESERILGRALGPDRDRVVLSTKAGIGSQPSRPEGLAPETLRRALEASLERLGTDRIDLYYLHLPDRKTPIEKTLDGMADLVASGRVTAWGTSNYAAWELLEMRSLAEGRGLAVPVVVQALYNVLHRQLEVEYFGFARRYPTHTIAYNALAGGLLSGKHRAGEPAAKGSRFDGNPMYQRRYWSEEMFRRVGQVADVARAEGCTLVQLAYAWLASRPDIDSILVGPATLEHLDDAIEAVGRRLSGEAAQKLDELARAWAGTDTNYVR